MEYIDKKLPKEHKKYLEAPHWHGLSKTSMPHYQPSVPKQRNYTDCGLFLLEYVEAFIRDPDFILKNLH